MASTAVRKYGRIGGDPAMAWEADIATPDMLRTLRYIRLLNDAGTHPTRHDVDVYAEARLPKVIRPNGYAYEAYREALQETFEVTLNTVTKYIEQVGWTFFDGEGVRLTHIGRLVLASASDIAPEEDTEQAIEVVLEGRDPISYAKFLAKVQSLDGQNLMLVDPYFPSTHLPTLLESTEIRHVLTLDARVADVGESQGARRKALATTLGAYAPRAPAVRFADKLDLHDRYIIPPSGGGLAIGRSLGGRQRTIVVQLSSATTDILRNQYGPIWGAAEPLAAVDLSHIQNKEVDEVVDANSAES